MKLLQSKSSSFSRLQKSSSFSRLLQSHQERST
jgi:hypothetical protein